MKRYLALRMAPLLKLAATAIENRMVTVERFDEEVRLNDGLHTYDLRVEFDLMGTRHRLAIRGSGEPGIYDKIMTPVSLTPPVKL